MTRSMPPMRETETIVNVRRHGNRVLRAWSLLEHDDGALGIQRPDWHDEGACVGYKQEHWFPTAGTEAAKHYRAARKVCMGCPVRVECATHGIDNERFGMWGGLTPHDRRRARLDSHRRAQLLRDVADGAVVAPIITAGRPPMPEPHPPWKAERAREMRASGMFLQRIADELEVGIATVHRWVGAK